MLVNCLNMKNKYEFDLEALKILFLRWFRGMKNIVFNMYICFT